VSEKPKWHDEDAVHQWVCAQLEAEDLESERQHYMRYANCDVPVGEYLKRVHDEAIHDVKEANNFDLLNSLARPSPLANFFLGLRVHPLPVGSEALTLLVDAATGKFKSREGRPGRSTQQKHGDPILMAVEELPRIEHFLRRHFPRKKGIRDCAI
jgi:hypothetical protein